MQILPESRCQKVLLLVLLCLFFGEKGCLRGVQEEKILIAYISKLFIPLMDDIVLYIIIGVAAVLASALLIWFRTKGYIDVIKRFYEKYKVIIDAYGSYIKQRDPKLYDELIDLNDVFKDAIADDEITREELIAIYKEAKDVYERCKELIDKK